jgi:hypothetical protein
LIAGFKIENIHTEVFAKYPDCKCAVYSLEISDKAYECIKNEITKFSENYKKAKYSWIGLWALTFGIKIKRKWRLTCSQFVALLLQSTNEVTLPKDPYLMLPTDFMSIDGVQLVYEGILNNCVINEPKKMHV